MPLVSIVMPVSNAAATLDECLDSIAAQTLDDFELVVIDDGSEDDSASIIERRNDARIRLLRRPHRGLVAALNDGLAQASCDVIARMDADDVMLPRRLELQHDFLVRHPDISLVGCLVELFPAKEINAGYREYVRWQNACIAPDEIANAIFVESPLAHPSVMFRRDVLADAADPRGIYRTGDFPEDYELWLRLHASGTRMAKVPEVLLRWRESAARTSRVDTRYSRSAFDGLRARYLARDPRLRSGRELAIWGAGFKSRQRVRLLADEGVTIHSWIDIDPRKIGRRLWELPIRDRGTLVVDARPFVLVYVTNHGAREEIAAFLAENGYVNGTDWLAVG